MAATRFGPDHVAVSLGFTGAFVGLACQDLSGARLHADFDSFSYRS
jgi:xylan 1,4-beta-xylosidase